MLLIVVIVKCEKNIKKLLCGEFIFCFISLKRYWLIVVVVMVSARERKRLRTKGMREQRSGRFWPLLWATQKIFFCYLFIFFYNEFFCCLLRNNIPVCALLLIYPLSVKLTSASLRILIIIVLLLIKFLFYIRQITYYLLSYFFKFNFFNNQLLNLILIIFLT